MNKKIIYNYMRPQKYFNKLLLFFTFVSIILCSIIIFNQDLDPILFLLKTFLIFFLIITIATIIEFYLAGEYISPFELYEIKDFAKNFIINIEKNKDYGKYLGKYDKKSIKNFKNKFSNNNIYTLNNIIKKNNVYTLKINIDNNKKHLIFNKQIKINVKKINNEFIIIRLL